MKPLGDLVEQQELRAGAQDAGNGEHLLFAAGQPRTHALAHLFQVREHAVNLVKAHAVLADARRQHEIFLDIEARENAALFRAIADAAERRDAVIGDVDELAAADHRHRAGAARYHAHDGAQRRGAAGTITAEKGDQLALCNLDIDAVEHMGLAIPGIEPAGFQKRRGHHATSSALMPI